MVSKIIILNILLKKVLQNILFDKYTFKKVLQNILFDNTYF